MGKLTIIIEGSFEYSHKTRLVIDNIKEYIFPEKEILLPEDFRKFVRDLIIRVNSGENALLMTYNDNIVFELSKFIKAYSLNLKYDINEWLEKNHYTKEMLLDVNNVKHLSYIKGELIENNIENNNLFNKYLNDYINKYNQISNDLYYGNFELLNKIILEEFLDENNRFVHKRCSLAKGDRRYIFNREVKLSPEYFNVGVDSNLLKETLEKLKDINFLKEHGRVYWDYYTNDIDDEIGSDYCDVNNINNYLEKA